MYYYLLYIGDETRQIATGGQGIFQDTDNKSWFKYFEVWNGWDEGKQLLHLPMLLRGQAWAVYKALGGDHTDVYADLKVVFLKS